MYILNGFLPRVYISVCLLQSSVLHIQVLCNSSKWRLFWIYLLKNQPDIVCLQEHNQHSFAGQVAFFGGYDIYYSRAAHFSGLCMLVKHDLQPLIAFNDP